MAGDFARRAGRLVAERDRPDRDFARDHAAEIGRQGRIVIARYPDPVAPRLHRRERVAVGRRQPLMRIAVVKAVAERDHHARVVPRDDGGEPAQRRDGVVGRQQHAARGEAGAFFQMQVGDDEQALLLPEQRAGEIGEEHYVCDRNLRSAHVLIISRRLRGCRHVLSCYPIASLTSSSAASASNSSAASP